MITDIDLNPDVGLQDVANIIIFYTHVSYWCRNGLFGHDKLGFYEFVAFSPAGVYFQPAPAPLKTSPLFTNQLHMFLTYVAM